MRPLSALGFALAVFLSTSVDARTAPLQAAAPQTARQALIEMFFGQAPNHLEKHLPDVTRRAFQNLEEANGQSVLASLSMLAKEAQAAGEKFETFDTGSMLFSVKQLSGGNHDEIEITVERDDLSGDEDQIELALHMTRDGKEETLPFIPRFTFAMKMESDVWRLDEISLSVRMPLADPDFLKSILQRQSSEHEQMALMSMRGVISAEKSYQSALGGFACTLAILGGASKEPGPERHPYLYDPQLTSGRKNGYVFAISACDASHYQLVAEPAIPDLGQRAFCADESGTVRSSADGKTATCLAGGEIVQEKAPTTVLRIAPPPQSNSASGATPSPLRVRVSNGVSQGLLLTKVQPIYPPDARAARIQGTVLMKATISTAGDVESLELISGHPMLAPAALEAVKLWKYRPYLLNGKAVTVETQITVNFALAER